MHVNKRLLAVFALPCGLMLAVAGCGSVSNSGGNTGNTSVSVSSANSTLPVQIPVDTLAQKAKVEGVIHGFSMPPTWANYGGIWSDFKTKYGLSELYLAEGNMTSGQELQAFDKEKNHPVGDVGDVGFSFGAIGKQMGVYAPFKNQYWNEIPKDVKDPEGYWAAPYYGLIVFEVNTDKVKDIPHTFADLLKPEYKGMIGYGDPRTAGEFFNGLLAAAYANGGSVSNIEPGIEYFAKLRKIGNWVTSINGTSAASALKTGQVGIVIAYNYTAQKDQQTFNGNPHIQLIVPSDATVAVPEDVVINKYAPHPYAARLFDDFVFSDQGQIDFARGGGIPIRLHYIKLPSDIHLPKFDPNKVHFITSNLAPATQTVNQKWAIQVLGQ